MTTDPTRLHDDANLEALRRLLATGEVPADRVRAYLDAIDEHDRHSRMQYGDDVHTYNDVPLARSDLRDMVNELDALDARREAARDALAAWQTAIEGDSGDAELEAGSELADVLAATFGIERN